MKTKTIKRNYLALKDKSKLMVNSIKQKREKKKVKKIIYLARKAEKMKREHPRVRPNDDS